MRGRGISPREAMRLAMAEFGEKASDEDLALYLGQRFGVKVESKFIPILRASVKELEYLASQRKEAAKGPGGEEGTGKESRSGRTA
jgi:hypothetical protein